MVGYIVEFNALWYNALRFCAALCELEGKQDRQQHLLELAEKTKQSFLDTFLNEYGYLYDYVDGNMIDWSVRPNMIFPVAFDYSPLSQDQKKKVLVEKYGISEDHLVVKAEGATNNRFSSAVLNRVVTIE